MTMPDARAGRAVLVESAGVDSDIDAEYAARLRKAGSFFWLDLSEVPRSGSPNSRRRSG
jgi:hypothetical protein